MQELLTSSFDRPILWNLPIDVEYPPFFTLFMVCTEALEEDLGLSPRDLRAIFCAEGMCAERGFQPTHQDPAWRHCAEHLDHSYAESARIYDRAVITHSKFLRDPRLLDWLARIFERVATHANELRGVGATVEDLIC